MPLLFFTLASHLLHAIVILILIHAVMSWFRPDPSQIWVRIINAVVEPILAPIRAILPTKGLGLDFSPLVAVLILEFIRSVLARAIYSAP